MADMTKFLPKRVYFVNDTIRRINTKIYLKNVNFYKDESIAPFFLIYLSHHICQTKKFRGKRKI